MHEAPDGTCLHLHRPPPRARGDEPAGLRGAAHGRPQGPRAGEDRGGARPQRADRRRPGPRHRERGEPHPGRDAAGRTPQDFGIEYYGVDDVRQGIVHIIGPEQGWTQPGMTIVCGDSHTATHGAFGALAHGIGTSEVEHVLATQTLIQRKAKNMKVEVKGSLGPGVTAKDITLSIIGATGTAGGTGHVIEYCGEAIRAPLDGRPDDGLQHGDRGRRARRADRARREDLRLRQGPAARAEGAAPGRWPRRTGARSSPTRARISTARSSLDAADIAPVVTWGTSPEDVLPITGVVPRPGGLQGRQGRRGAAQPRLHGADARAPGCRTSRSTRSSSAPAPTAGSRTCARWRR